MKSRRFMIVLPENSNLLVRLAFVGRGRLGLTWLVEILRIDVLRGRDVDEQPSNMPVHGGSCFLRVMRLDRGQDRLVLGDDLGHSSGLWQGQQAIAVDLDLDLLNPFPDAGIACDLGDRSVKCFVRLMEARTVARGVGFALALNDGM